MTAAALPEHVDPEWLAAFFERLAAGTEAAADGAGGWQRNDLVLGGDAVGLRTAGATATRMLRPLSHVAEACALDTRPALQIDVLVDIGTLPETTWDWTQTAYENGDLSFGFDADRRALAGYPAYVRARSYRGLRGTVGRVASILRRGPVPA